MKRDEFILYGLGKHKQIIDKIIYDLHAEHEKFDIRLILTEALMNAFKHGNIADKDKPIQLKYFSDGVKVIFEIKDAGKGFTNMTIPDVAPEEKLLSDCGRGLFLIKCLSHKVEFRNNSLIIEKYLNNIKINNIN